MASENLTRQELAAELDAILQKGVDAGAPGLSAAVCSSHEVLWQSAAGFADLSNDQPLHSSHVFGIGSITKMFVAVVILQLVDESSLKLSNTVGELLKPEVYADIDDAGTATIEQLLGHTAGIDSWEDNVSWIVHGRGKEIVPEHIWGKLEPLDYIRRSKANAPSVGEYYYANTNYTLLGLIIEEITKNAAEEEIRSRILEPLDMDHTHLEGFEKAPNPDLLPRRYHWATDTFRETAGVSPSFPYVKSNLIDVTSSNLSSEWVAGGFISSTTDLLKFATALRDGRLLSASALEFMKQWKTRPAPSQSEVGHGIFRISFPPSASSDKWLGHTGGVLGFTAMLLWSETGDCAVAVLGNAGIMHAGAVPYDASKIVMSTPFLEVAARLAVESTQSGAT
ncbi:D-stereospecific peptide hydrolase [Xylariales sp. PMI_506]|nr:D-stereospecific peptide hydrolase [Xylariales sp. PMI_506]